MITSLALAAVISAQAAAAQPSPEARELLATLVEGAYVIGVCEQHVAPADADTFVGNLGKRGDAGDGAAIVREETMKSYAQGRADRAKMQMTAPACQRWIDEITNRLARRTPR